MSTEKTAEKTVPVSVFEGDRAVIRAIAGAADELPAATVRRAIQALRSADPRADAVAALAQGGDATANARRPRKPAAPATGRDGADK